RGDRDGGFLLTNLAEAQDGQWGEGIDWNKMTFDFDSKKMKKGLEWLKELNEYAPKGVLSNQGNEKFLTEENNIAIQLTQGPADSIQDANALGLEDRFDMTDDFSNSDGVGGMFAGSPVAIAKDSKHKDLAWEFVKFV